MNGAMSSRISPAQGAIALAVLLCVSTVCLGDANPPPASDDDTERKPLFTVIPDYPEKARRDRIEGEVQVCFDVTRNGRTRRIAVRKSSHRIFERPAIRAVRASSYKPLPKDAAMSGIKACRTFRFTLEPVVVEKND